MHDVPMCQVGHTCIRSSLGSQAGKCMLVSRAARLQRARSPTGTRAMASSSAWGSPEVAYEVGSSNSKQVESKFEDVLGELDEVNFVGKYSVDTPEEAHTLMEILRETSDSLGKANAKSQVEIDKSIESIEQHRKQIEELNEKVQKKEDEDRRTGNENQPRRYPRRQVDRAHRREGKRGQGAR